MLAQKEFDPWKWIRKSPENELDPTIKCHERPVESILLPHSYSQPASMPNPDLDALATNAVFISNVPISKVSVAGTNSTDSSIASNSQAQQGGENTTITFLGDPTPPESLISEGSMTLAVKDYRCIKDRRKRPPIGRKASASLGPVKKRLRTECLLPPYQPPLTPIAPAPTKTVLLGLPSDSKALNPLHVFVRQQIEVFCATTSDLNQPAPGRKNRLHLHQVGLRCIHCRDLPAKERVKRAVCYPSQVSRVYHACSDMKFDHFAHCKGMPDDVRQELIALKEQCRNSTHHAKAPNKATSTSSASSTAQYYHDAAHQIGMVDSPIGVFLSKNLAKANSVSSLVCEVPGTKEASSARMNVAILPKQVSVTSLSSILPLNKDPPKDKNAPVRDGMEHFAYSSLPLLFSFPRSTSPTVTSLMASSEDADHLNPIHCFIRQHVEYFAASRTDIAAPAPGRKTRVALGQVGLRCVHCAASGDRIKRSVCYPANVAGIYHGISNMKFDHFGKCPGLPPSERSRFDALRAMCGRHGGGGARGFSNQNSTAQYYQDSARLRGLVDSDTGIRFHDACSGGKQALTGNDMATDGISALMIAASVRAASNLNETAV